MRDITDDFIRKRTSLITFIQGVEGLTNFIESNEWQAFAHRRILDLDIIYVLSEDDPSTIERKKQKRMYDKSNKSEYGGKNI